MIIKAPTQADLPALKSLWQQAFGDPIGFIEGFFQTGYNPDRSLVLCDGETIAAVAYWFDCLWEGKKCAYVYGVATASAYQGKGLCRALMTQLQQQLTAGGYVGAILVPAKEGLFSLYQKLGYAPFCPMKKQTFYPANAVCVTHAPAEQYTPAGSVIHTSDALLFLETYCKFYSGDGFRCWGAVEDATLYIQEFVGDAACISGICAGLGAEKAVCRIYGSGNDYAMYLPLRDPDFHPSYFGIPLD